MARRSSAPRPIIPALAKSIRAQNGNASANKGVGASNGLSTQLAVNINQSAFLRMTQAVMGDVQDALSTQGWGPYFTATCLRVASKTILKAVQQARDDDAQLNSQLKPKALEQFLKGWHVPAAVLAAMNAQLTTLFNALWDIGVPVAKSVQNTVATDAANVAAAQALVAQGQV